MLRILSLLFVLLVALLGLFGATAAFAVQIPVHAAGSPHAFLEKIAPNALCTLGFQINGKPFCTHGDDPAPQGLVIAARVAPLVQAAVPAAVICDGDGVSGKRVQVLYVHAEDVADRYATYVDSIRTWSAQADAIFSATAQATGGQRHLRFVTNSTCQIDVQNVTIAAAADDDLADTVAALTLLGYDNPQRKYLLFVDATAYCGTATIQYDSQPSLANANENMPGYARVDSGCWGARAVAHELTHTLGSVQFDAPHSSRGWHCTDEHDIMCYSDVPHFPAVTFPCTEADAENLLDCNHDDYFHTAPLAASYLATHWNVANSHFLIAANTPSPPPTVTLRGPQADMIYQMPITLTLVAQATAPDGNFQRLELYSNTTPLVITTTATLSYTWGNVPAGLYTLQAKAYDEVGNSATGPAIQFMVTDADDSVGGQGGISLPRIQHMYLAGIWG